jgi:predicted transcriptional regulator
MAKGALFTLKLEPELRTEFMAAAAAADRPASQIVRELMRGYVRRQTAARAREAQRAAGLVKASVRRKRE